MTFRYNMLKVQIGLTTRKISDINKVDTSTVINAREFILND